MAPRSPYRLSPRLALILLAVVVGIAVAVALLWPPVGPVGGGVKRISPRVGEPVVESEPPAPAPAPAPFPPEPPIAAEVAPVRVAIVVDDLGRDLAAVDRLLATGEAITFSILPFLPHSLEVAARVHAAGEEVLLHLPMEPRAYPRIQPGQGGLLRSMDEATLCRQLDRDLAAVPFLDGVNNHMGSRLTEEVVPMAVVMAELQARHLFFLDSRTSPHSVAGEQATRAGLPWLARDLFLDNDPHPEAIALQFDELIARALRVGQAIAIGHPHPATLDALEAALPRLREAGIAVVPLVDLLPPADLLPPPEAMEPPPTP